LTTKPAYSPTADAVRERIEAFRARRGYVLPHQGAMAAALPELQDVYGVVYKTLTLDTHHLDAFEREFVWLALLTAAKEHVGTHHIDLFFKAGGTDRQAQAAFRLVAWAQGVETFQFLEKHWEQYFPVPGARAAYVEGKTALLAESGDVASELTHLALLVAFASRDQHWGLEVELEDCYARGVSEAKIAEALSLVLWPCGVNRFLEASGVWLKVLRSGKVTPSAPFKAWADTPDQEGFYLAPRTDAGKNP
jgi:alkylhydroperoxidase/carboxymuconolactone decarboxylase family protein YurZ